MLSSDGALFALSAMVTPAMFTGPDFYFTLIGLLESFALLSTSLLLFRCFTIGIPRHTFGWRFGLASIVLA